MNSNSWVTRQRGLPPYLSLHVCEMGRILYSLCGFGNFAYPSYGRILVALATGRKLVMCLGILGSCLAYGKVYVHFTLIWKRNLHEACL